MAFESLPTHLGGKYKNLAWEDLNPYELTLASCGSYVKAQALLPLAEGQIAAAEELGDIKEVKAYEYAHWVLSELASLTARKF